MTRSGRDLGAALLAALGVAVWAAGAAFRARMADDLQRHFAARTPVLLVGTALLLALAPRLAGWLCRTTRLAPATTDRERLGRIFVLSFSGLVLELAAIRWVGAEVRAFAYFKNFVLVSAFLGFGLGFALGPRRERLFPASLVGLAVTAVLVLMWNDASIYPALTNQEQTWGHFTDARDPLKIAFMLLFFLLSLASFFVTLTGTFAALTQELGTLFEEVPRIPAYAVNLAGSLAGVLAYNAASWAGTPPALWFALGALPLAALLDEKRLRLAFAGLLAVVLGVAHVVDQNETSNDAVHRWSPYYRVSVGPPEAYIANVASHARYAASTNREVMTIASLMNPWIYQAMYGTAMPFNTYSFPELLKPHKRRVLVLAAGMGNDVTMALIAGAPPEKVVAVEIDPEIARFAKLLNPDRPFDDERVELVIDDARHYLETTHERFDLVVMSYLDSHTLISGYSQLRTDNFLYTRECFERVRAILAPDGVFVVGYASEREWLVSRIVAALRAAFGEEPLTAGGGAAFCAVGPGLEGRPVPAPIAYRMKNNPLVIAPDQDYPTDDRPFLTLAGRTLPSAYWIAIVAVLAMTVGALRAAALPLARIDLRFLLLGAAFLLAETRLVTYAGLLFGVTWHAYGIAISLVLAALIAGTLVAGRLPPLRPWPFYVLVVAAIAGSQLVPVASLVRLEGPLRLAAALALYGPTFLLASVVFGLELRRTDGAAAPFALASNLLGSVAGGLLEYQAVPFGISSLAITACGLYVLAAVAPRRA